MVCRDAEQLQVTGDKGFVTELRAYTVVELVESSMQTVVFATLLNFKRLLTGSWIRAKTRWNPGEQTGTLPFSHYFQPQCHG